MHTSIYNHSYTHNYMYAHMHTHTPTHTRAHAHVHIDLVDKSNFKKPGYSHTVTSLQNYQLNTRNTHHTTHNSVQLSL